MAHFPGLSQIGDGQTNRLRELMEQVASGLIKPEEATRAIEQTFEEDIGFAVLDHQRMSRKGVPEVVYGEGKTPEQVTKITEKLLARSELAIITRANESTFKSVRATVREAQYSPLARMIWADRRSEAPANIKGVKIVSAGTSDAAIVEEAALTSTLMGCEVEKITDVGVAGLHRLLSRVHKLRSARVIVAVAGMEGALPGVIAGLVACPVIGVPTSQGYGTSLGGTAALLTMLNSCSQGLCVVNIDAGHSAGYLAAVIVRSGKQTEIPKL